MSKIAIPEPVAVVVSDFAIFWAGTGPVSPLIERNGVRVGSLLITTDQAEAYATAKVREALEEAALLVNRNSDQCSSLVGKVLLSSNADAIRALIPK